MASMFLCATCGDIKGFLCRKRACKEARGDNQEPADGSDIDEDDLLGLGQASPVRTRRRAHSAGAGAFE